MRSSKEEETFLPMMSPTLAPIPPRSITGYHPTIIQCFSKKLSLGVLSVCLLEAFVFSLFVALPFVVQSLLRAFAQETLSAVDEESRE